MPVHICPIEPFLYCHIILTIPSIFALCSYTAILPMSLVRNRGVICGSSPSWRLSSSQAPFPESHFPSSVCPCPSGYWPVSSFTFSVSCNRKTWMKFLVSPAPSLCVRMIWCILASQSKMSTLFTFVPLDSIMTWPIVTPWLMFVVFDISMLKDDDGKPL